MKLNKHTPKLILLSLILLVSCHHQPKKSELNFDWLVGEWIRTNDTENRLTFEYWSKISEHEYIGLGCTLQNQDTVFKEDIRLVKTDTSWIFMVYGVNEQPTPFVITNTTDSSFTCKNDQNEFPKKIKYTKADAQLLAIISDAETEIAFRFKQK